MLAAQTPCWEPGTKPGYHALTQGFLIGEVIRRITGTSVGALFRSELAEPLGGAEFWIGLPAALDDRVAPLLPAPGEPTSPPDDAPELAVRAQYNPIVSAAATS